MNALWARSVFAVLVGGTLLLLWFPVEIRVLWPSAVALVLVFVTRKVMLSLLLGGFVGSLLLVGGNPVRAFLDLVEFHLLPHFGSGWKVGAVIFTLLMGGLVALLERSGGMTALFQRWLHRPGPRRVEAVTCMGGLICFFDGLANALMIGRLMQPFARQAKLSAARLAYVVDTTSSAVACLAFVSTWIAYQLAMIHEGYVLAGREGDSQPYLTFFQSIPYNYYCWFALSLLAVVVLRQIQWGPMRRYTRPPVVGGADAASTPGIDSSPWRALGPIAVLLVGIPVGIYLDGVQRAELSAWPISAESVSIAFGAAHTPLILIAASVLASLVALLSLPVSQREGSAAAYLTGLEQLFRPVLILISAWVLSSTLNQLEAGAFLSQLVGDHLAVDYLPLVVFLAGALIAFSTGTSWGTMGLLMPLAVAMCLDLPDLPAHLIPAVVGAVFSGAVFGDHCSPISDTTIVSSIACGIDPFDHVRTQLPYALVAAAWSVAAGFLLLVFLPVKPLVLPIGLLAMVSLLLWRSRRRS
ncbi:MAG: hypothetical protein JJU20_02155 [Opitutales bacterium]|nr:hypothetical protein [Opitutales bacterium]